MNHTKRGSKKKTNLKRKTMRDVLKGNCAAVHKNTQTDSIHTHTLVIHANVSETPKTLTERAKGD